MSDQSETSSPDPSDQSDEALSANQQPAMVPIVLPSAKAATRPVSKNTRPAPARGAMPLWLPLAALIIALIFAAYIAVKISPTLALLISPPQPVLPEDAVLQSQGSDSIGDWWLYQSATNGCLVAKVYQDALGTCIYNPSSGCGSSGALAIPGANQIAECSGSKTTGSYHVTWRVYLTAEYDIKNGNQPLTVFRIYRDIG